jgi:hypothetical protein
MPLHIIEHICKIPLTTDDTQKRCGCKNLEQMLEIVIFFSGGIDGLRILSNLLCQFSIISKCK